MACAPIVAAAIGMLALCSTAGHVSAQSSELGRRLALGSPIGCELGVDCWVSTYFDHDPSGEWSDHACGPVTYDSHGGIDFAIPTDADMRKGVAVTASAPGTVIGLRDGMPDIGINKIGGAKIGETETGGDRIKGRDCGNGVVLDHGGGWQTQYCHLRKGSVRVREGQRVAAGAELGIVGLSGRTQRPHLHLTVRTRTARRSISTQEASA